MGIEHKLNLFIDKMKVVDVNQSTIDNFCRSYRLLCQAEPLQILEKDLASIADLPELVGIEKRMDFLPNQLDQTIIIKLNGGLGTSMGLDQPKSSILVRGDKSFLDLIAKKILYLRASQKSKVRFLCMNSFYTSQLTCELLHKYRCQGLEGREELELLQNQVPKIDRDSLDPVTWDINPSLEWYPPGHADLYLALWQSGKLEELLAQGVKYAFVSNSDNLGATLEPTLLNYFVESNAPFLMEVTKRTQSDRKGGHLAKFKRNNRLILREISQCKDSELTAFQNIEKHGYFNTNNLWFRLDAIKDWVGNCKGVLPLPVVSNYKTVDPRDPSSTQVIQLEAALGTAIEQFTNAQAIIVSRTRFSPVKTTADLWTMRSDVYKQDDSGTLKLDERRLEKPPFVVLDNEYRLCGSLDSLGMPSLLKVDEVEIKGLVTFDEGVILEGKILIVNQSGSRKLIPKGVYSNQELSWENDGLRITPLD